MTGPSPKRAFDDSTASEPSSKRGKLDIEVPGKSKAQTAQEQPLQRPKKGNRSGRRRGTRPEGGGKEKDDGVKGTRLPKRPCALLIGFSGTGYYGMQVQTNVRTIEGTLFESLVKAGAVSEDNADDPVKVALQRAARTDAGVHAAGNVVSMRMITSVPGIDDIVSHINSILPPEIRLWGFVRTPKSFNARTNCDSRQYTYFMPSYLLIPPKPGSGLSTSLGLVQSETDTSSLHPFWRDVPSDSKSDEDLQRKRTYRATTAEVDTFRDVMKKYEGSHNFHNFTIGREFNDRSCQRFMKSVEVHDPVVYDDTEWISIRLHGQSFMLHQIRKMVCAAVLASRTNTPSTIIPEMCGPQRVIVPKAPALGLLLENPIFEKYNSRMEAVNAGIAPDIPDREQALRPPIDFEQYRVKMEEFKQEFIYKDMRSQESRDGTFDGWIRSIDSYSGSDLSYYNPKGLIPDICVVKRGQRRIQSFKEEKKFDGASTDVRDSEDEAEVDSGLLVEMEG